MGDVYFQPTIVNKLDVAIRIIDFYLRWGKCCSISGEEAKSPDNTVIPGGGEFTFKTCGLESSPSGVEGSFALVCDKTGEKIARIYWNIPWVISSQLEAQDVNVEEGYKIVFAGFSTGTLRTLGEGTITVIKE